MEMNFVFIEDFDDKVLQAAVPSIPENRQKVQDQCILSPEQQHDAKTSCKCHLRQSEQAHLEFDQKQVIKLSQNHMEVNDDAPIPQASQMHHAHKQKQQIQSEDNSPQFQRTQQIDKSPFSNLQNTMMHGFGLSKPSKNLKRSKIIFKNRNIIQGQHAYSQSKLTVKENNYLKPHLKNKNSYDQLMDKNLIQYLYTRQNRIFDQEQTTLNLKPDKKPQDEKPRKIVEKSPTYNLASRLKLIKRENKPYEIKSDCRKTKCNIFDMISCQQSKKQNEKYNTFKSARSSQSTLHLQRQGKPQLQILKNRINKLQEKVYHKVPFLIQMGVKFKYKKP